MVLAMRPIAHVCITVAVALALISCTKGPPSADALLGNTITECDAAFGKRGMLAFTVLGDDQLSNFTGLVAPISSIRYNFLVWPKDDSTYYCTVSNGIVSDCFKASVINGTHRVEDSKTLLGLAPSDRISSNQNLTFVSLPTSSPLGLAPVTLDNIPNPRLFSGMITYRASYSRFLYDVVFKDGIADRVNVTDIGSYGETAE